MSWKLINRSQINRSLLRFCGELGDVPRCFSFRGYITAVTEAGQPAIKQSSLRVDLKKIGWPRLNFIPIGQTLQHFQTGCNFALKSYLILSAVMMDGVWCRLSLFLLLISYNYVRAGLWAFFPQDNWLRLWNMCTQPAPANLQRWFYDPVSWVVYAVLLPSTACVVQSILTQKLSQWKATEMQSIPPHYFLQYFFD